jgi:hypothetical protein
MSNGTFEFRFDLNLSVHGLLSFAVLGTKIWRIVASPRTCRCEPGVLTYLANLTRVLQSIAVIRRDDDWSKNAADSLFPAHSITAPA